MTREEAVEIATKWATEFPHWQATDQVAQAVRLVLSKLHQDAGNGELLAYRTAVREAVIKAIEGAQDSAIPEPWEAASHHADIATDAIVALERGSQVQAVRHRALGELKIAQNGEILRLIEIEPEGEKWEVVGSLACADAAPTHGGGDA
jgi:hypothetical protein